MTRPGGQHAAASSPDDDGDITRPLRRQGGGYPQQEPPPALPFTPRPIPDDGDRGGPYPPLGPQGHYGGPSWPGPGWPPTVGPPPTRPRRRISSGTLAIVLLLAAIVLISGGAAAWSAFADSSDGAPVSTAPSPAPSPAAPGAPPSIPPDADTGGDVSVDVEVGDCITLRGTVIAATAVPAACGSPEANFKVIAKTPTADDCPTDADQAYYETLRGGEVGALCLDIDWVEGDCFELSGQDPKRVDCTAPGLRTVRVGETVHGTDDASVCPEGGFPYPARRLVVCAEEVPLLIATLPPPR